MLVLLKKNCFLLFIYVALLNKALCFCLSMLNKAKNMKFFSFFSISLWCSFIIGKQGGKGGIEVASFFTLLNINNWKHSCLFLLVL